ENWAPLVTVGQRLVEMDPLNYDGSLILATAYRDTNQDDAAYRELDRMENTPIKLQNLETRQGAGRTTVSGQAIGNKAAAGSPVQLRFTFFNESGQEIGAQSVTIQAPAADATAPFEVVLESETPATGYRYQVVN